MNKMKLTRIFTGVAVFFPAIAFAEECSGVTSGCTAPTDISSLFCYALCVLSGYVIPFLFGLGLLIFLIGVVNYVRAGDNEEKRQAGRDLMWFGIVALFVMVSVWGFVKILFTSFFPTESFSLPSLPNKAGSVFKNP